MGEQSAWQRPHIRRTLLLCSLGAILAASSLTPRTASADSFGIGIIVGEPTGVSFKVGRTGRNAIDAAVAWSLSGDNDLHLQADWLYNNFDLIPVGQGQLAILCGDWWTGPFSGGS